ncbi:MAG: hypothetical protein IKV97_00475 [Clostridia bacterium]|nr:hypothetical protein [Clostridia bacterium]
MSLLRCAAYYTLTGFMLFLFGRVIPERFLDPDKFPFRALPFEKDGEIYEKLSIKSWQSKLPDMSKVFTSFMPPKNITGHLDVATLQLMIKETCVAELVHIILMATGLGSFRFFKAKTAFIVYLIFVFINLPFIIIQRYNRPRLVHLLERYLERQACECGITA